MDIFCKIIEGEIPSKKIYEDDVVMVILDVNPIRNGHSLIIPKKHYQDLYDIPDEVLSHIMKISREMSKKLTEKLSCQGITLEENNGISQDVKHFHLHVIPKYSDDYKKLDIEEVFHKIVD